MLAGTKATAHHGDGFQEDTLFPAEMISDQPVAPFAKLCGISHEIIPGQWAQLSFSGELFEMENQRN